MKNAEGAENPWTVYSHSGNERNRSFLNVDGSRFLNVSGISGADSPLDGRAFVVFDYDRDGRLDLASVNANGPVLRIYGNRTATQNGFLAIRFVGSDSNRDAIGTRVVVDTGVGNLVRTVSAGEGFASQNSKTLVIGIGEQEAVASIQIHWPSGQETRVGPTPAGTLLLAHEISGLVDCLPY